MLKKTFPVEEIKVLLEEDYDIGDLAQKYATSRPTMSKFLKENSLYTKKQLHNQRCKELDVNFIINEYQSGIAIKEIAEKLNVSPTVIKDRLRDNNIHIRTNSESHKKYTEDYNYFNIIDTYDKAYLLGFICADGWVTNRNELGIGIAYKDKDLIYWFKEQLKTDKEPIIKEKNGNKSIWLVIQNEKLTNILNKYNIIPNKSLVLNIKEVANKANISDELMPAFLLGYFDGDGGIYKTLVKTTMQYSCSVTGTLETCTFFQEYFGNIGFMTKRHKDNKNNYTYQIGGRNKVREGLSKLYFIKDKLSFFYKRKYEIYCEL